MHPAPVPVRPFLIDKTVRCGLVGSETVEKTVHLKNNDPDRKMYKLRVDSTNEGQRMGQPQDP